MRGWIDYLNYSRVEQELKADLEDECGTEKHPNSDRIFHEALENCEGDLVVLCNYYKSKLKENLNG